MRARRLGVLPIVVLVMSACTSGPPPPPDADDRPYAQQIESFRAEKDTAFRTGADSPIPAATRRAFAGLAYFPIDPSYHVPAVLTADPGMANTAAGYAPRPERRPVTKFERRGVAAGRAIFDLVFHRS